MSTPAPAARLRLDGVRIAVAGRTLADGVHLELSAGEIVAVVAPSGAGKTTLLRSIVRLADHASGAIELDGQPIGAIDGPGLRRRVALVTQRPLLLGPTVADDLRAGARASAPPSGSADLVTSLGLPATMLAQPSSELSGGEQARVAIARALLGDPSVLLLDEPSAALDAESTGLLSALLRERAAAGLAILLSTHDPELLAHTDARVIELPITPPPA